MQYFITGATGFIGGHVANQLLDAGHEVRVLARTPAKAEALAARGAQIVKGDITDPGSMRDGMTGVDGVFHVAGWYEVGTRDKSPAMTINVEGTRNVLTLMKELSVPKGVYSSTIAAFSNTGGQVVDETYRYEGKHLTTYDLSKWRAHYEVADPLIEEGLPLVIVHPGMVYGPEDHSAFHLMLNHWLRGLLPFVPAEFGACFAHVADVARGHVLAMEQGIPGQNYIIGGPPMKLSEVFDVCAGIAGKAAPPLKLPTWFMKLNAGLMAPLDPINPLPPIFTGEAMRNSAGVTYYGTDAKAREELGFSTRPLADGLRETLAWEYRHIGQEPPFAV